MSGYDDDRRHDRGRHRRSPVYEEEEIIQARRGPKGSKKDRGALVPKRRDSSESSVEDILRAFPPKGYDRSRDDYQRKRAKSARESKRNSRYDDYDSYDSYDDKPRHRGSKRECLQRFQT